MNKSLSSSRLPSFIITADHTKATSDCHFRSKRVDQAKTSAHPGFRTRKSSGLRAKKEEAEKSPVT